MYIYEIEEQEDQSTSKCTYKQTDVRTKHSFTGCFASRMASYICPAIVFNLMDLMKSFDTFHSTFFLYLRCLNLALNTCPGTGTIQWSLWQVEALEYK